MEGVVTFGEIGASGAGEVFLDDGLIASYRKGKDGYVLVGLDRREIVTVPKRASLVAHVKDYAKRLTEPVEVTITLPAGVARLIPDVMTVTLSSERRLKNSGVPVLYETARNAVAASKPTGLPYERAIGYAAMQVIDDVKAGVFAAVAEKLAEQAP